MARHHSRTTIRREAFLLYADTLRRMADVHEQLAKLMEQAEIETIDPTHIKTAASGLVNLGKFMGAAINAYCDNANAKGVSEIAGATAELLRLTKRIAREKGVKKALPDPMRDHAKYQQHAEAEEHAAVEDAATRLAGGGKKKRKAKGT